MKATKTNMKKVATMIAKEMVKMYSSCISGKIEEVEKDFSRISFKHYSGLDEYSFSLDIAIYAKHEGLTAKVFNYDSETIVKLYA